MKDRYLDAIGEAWPTILRAYGDFKDRDTVIEFEMRRRIVYAYPAFDYINDLSSRTREQTHQLWREAAAAGQFLVFVRDTKNRVLRSYVFPVEDRVGL